jgi:hypothetical protein
MDDERLKGMKNIGDDYFDELIERIRDIRATEKRFYKKIIDIYALSIDYNPNGDCVILMFVEFIEKLA